MRCPKPCYHGPQGLTRLLMYLEQSSEAMVSNVAGQCALITQITDTQFTELFLSIRTSKAHHDM